jgi:hypothetical protein
MPRLSSFAVFKLLLKNAKMKHAFQVKQFFGTSCYL